MPIRMLKKEKKPAGFKSTQQKGNIVKGKLKSQKELKDIMKSDEYKKSDYEGKTKMLNVATHKAGGLTGGQVKLDKNKDGKISGEDFKMMKRKRGGSTPGLKDYVKKSDGQEKMIKVIEDGITKFVKRSKVMDNPSKYKPAPSSMNSKEKSQGGSPFRKAILERANKREPGGRFSEVDIEFAKQSLKRKGGGSAISKEKRKRGAPTRKNPNSPKGQNPISEYGPQGKLKYTAANKGAMINKSTKGYGAARTFGMGLQDEQVKPGKVQKAVVGMLALGAAGALGAKKLKKKKATMDPGGSISKMPINLLEEYKKAAGKKTGGSISGLGKQQGRQGKPLAPGNMMNKERLAKLKQQLNRFKNRSTKGGGADESKRMSDKTKTGIKRLMDRIARLTPTGRAGSDAGKILKERLKKKIMTPAKKMGGGMMMKKYNKGGSVTASCKLGRNKATKLY